MMPIYRLPVNTGRLEVISGCLFRLQMGVGEHGVFLQDANCPLAGSVVVLTVLQGEKANYDKNTCIDTHT